MIANICSLVFSPVKPKIEESPTDVLKQIIPNVNDNDYHDATARFLPVLARPLLGLNVNQLFTLMLGKIPADHICQRKPTSVTYSSVFVVDLTNVRCIDDLRADDNGVWCHGGKPRRKYIVECDSDTSEVIKVSPVDEHLDSKEDDIFTLVRMYHHHKATPEFQRRISYVIDSSEQTVQYAVVQYLFDGGKEVPVVLLPHGNTKNTTTQYRRTQKSTLSHLKEVSGKPKDVVSLLYEEAGSVLEANSVSELPRDRRQVYNNQQSTSKSTSGVDPLFELVQQCKVDLQPGGRKFIRSVTFETGNCCTLPSITNALALLNTSTSQPMGDCQYHRQIMRIPNPLLLSTILVPSLFSPLSSYSITFPSRILFYFLLLSLINLFTIIIVLIYSFLFLFYFKLKHFNKQLLLLIILVSSLSFSFNFLLLSF